MTARTDIAACYALLKGGSRSFHAASLLLPRAVADPAVALYAFCRLADDAVDLDGDQGAALAQWRQRLDQAYRGQPAAHAADRAFARVVQQHAIPRALPEALLEGLSWDAEGRRYETLTDLMAYAARVAGSVGAMMTLVMDARAPDVVARACDLGVAMQLTNIARDVGEDARAGRLYLPLQWLREATIDPETWMRQPTASPAIASLVQRLLDVADGLYARAAVGIARLPLPCRPGMHAARVLYAEIGREIERAGLDSVTQRAVVPLRRKLGVLAGMTIPSASRLASSGMLAHPPLAEARFLVDAVIAVPRRPAPLPARSVEGRMIWLLDLFTRLERRDRLLRENS